LSVSQINDLEVKVQNGEVRFKVYKNTLIKRAMEEVGGFEDLYPHLEEQNGFAFVNEELAAPAKVLKEYMKEHKKPEFVAALVEGEYYGGNQLETLASMKSKMRFLEILLVCCCHLSAMLLVDCSHKVGRLPALSKRLPKKAKN
jgi:large subunit ribosomal protein L10